MLLGDLRLELGELEEAGALLVESLERFTASGDPFGIGWARCGAGKLATARAEYATAVDHFAASLSLSQHIGHRTGVGLSLIGLAHTAVRTGRPLRAAQLFAAAAAVADAVGVPLHLHYGASYDQALADTRAYLGASRYERAWTQGQAMTAEEAVAYALTGATAG